MVSNSETKETHVIRKSYADLPIKILIGAMIYFGGMVAYSTAHFFPKGYVDLARQQTESVRRIGEFQRFIPLMKEPFQSQYKDSLENAIRDTSQINPRIREMSETLDRNIRKSFYSWAAFFMD